MGGKLKLKCLWCGIGEEACSWRLDPRSRLRLSGGRVTGSLAAASDMEAYLAIHPALLPHVDVGKIGRQGQGADVIFDDLRMVQTQL